MEKTTKKRVIAYIDGFNVYHGLHDFRSKNPGFLPHGRVNYRVLCEEFVREGQELVAIKYFSAYPTWDKDAWDKHKRFIALLDSVGVQFIEGQFKRKNRLCDRQQCVANRPEKKDRRIVTREEKKTDVNLALEIMLDAIDHNYDVALIVTGDSDIVPAVEKVKQRFRQNRQIIAIRPLERISGALENMADTTMVIDKNMIKRSLFP